MHLVQVAMLKGFLREFQLPVVCASNTLSLISFGFLPSVEVTYQVYLSSVRSPLTEYPSACCLMQTIVFISVCKISKFVFSIVSKSIQFPQSVVVTALYSLLKRLKIAIVLNQTYVLYSRFLCNSLTFIRFCSHN